MTRTASSVLAAFAALAMAGAGIGAAGIAQAQTSPLAQAIAAGTVGEQSDGYLGIAGAASAEVRSEVDALNIKRRALYTDLAAKRGVTVSDAAAATGCQTLAARVKPGQVYRITGGPWQTKGAGAIILPDYCASTS